MRVPTRDYSSLQTATQAAGQAKGAIISAKANSHLLQKFDLAQEKIQSQIDYNNQQMTYSWIKLGLGLAQTASDTAVKVYDEVQTQRKAKAVNEGMDKLNALSQEESANGGWSLVEDPSTGKKVWKEDEHYAKRRQEIFDGLQSTYGLDDSSLAQVQSSLGTYVMNSRTTMQDAALKNMQEEYATNWNSTTGQFLSEAVAGHAESIIGGDTSSLANVFAQVDSNPYITDKDGAKETFTRSATEQSRKEVLGNTVDRRGTAEAYKQLKGWNLDADTEASLHTFINQRAVNRAEEVRSTVEEYASGIQKKVNAKEEGASWSKGYEDLNGYLASMSSEDADVARTAFMGEWTKAGNSEVSETLHSLVFSTSAQTKEAYDTLSQSETFRAMPAEYKDTILQPLAKEYEDKKKLEDSLGNTISKDNLKLFNDTAEIYTASYNNGEIGRDEYISSLWGAYDSYKSASGAEPEDLSMVKYINNVLLQSMEDKVPTWLKPDWKDGISMIDSSVQEVLGIKNLEKTMNKNPEKYQRYLSLVQDCQSRLLGWIDSAGNGKQYNATGFAQELQDMKTWLNSGFIEIAGESATGADGLQTGGLANGDDFNTVLSDIAGMPLNERGAITLNGDKEKATAAQVYVEGARRMTGCTVTVIDVDGSASPVPVQLELDTDGGVPPMYATSPTGQTLQAYADKTTGEVFAGDSAGNIYQCVAVDVKSHGKPHKEWRIYGDPVGTYETFGGVGSMSSRNLSHVPTSAGGALAEFKKRYETEKPGYKEMAIMDSLQGISDQEALYQKTADKAEKELIEGRIRNSIDELLKCGDETIEAFATKYKADHLGHLYGRRKK